MKKQLPTIIRGENRSNLDFPLPHYSYSTFVKFSTNPILFKINYLNGDRFDTTTSISAVMGKAFHRALEVYFSGQVEDPVKQGLEAALYFLHEYQEGFIEYSKTVETKSKAAEIVAFAYTSYVSEIKKEKGLELIGCELEFTERVDVDWKGQRLTLPVPLRGYVDRLDRSKKGLIIRDYKLVYNFTDGEKIDGRKILQAVQYYLGVYAMFGEAPYSMVFEEIKRTKNRDGSPQVRSYEFIFKDNEQFFDLYFRFYQDVTDAINGKAVFVPNIETMFDNEVSVLAYIHRLDEPEEKAKEMKRLKVESVTDLLKEKIQNAGSMKKFLQAAEKQFVSAVTLKYEDMTIEERIRAKLLEHGMVIEFDSVVEGYSFDLYRYRPSIALKMSKLKGFLADIELVTGMSGIRILAPIPDTSLIGFEVPRKERRYPTEVPKPNGFFLAIGMTLEGNVLSFDITKAPHMLVAGATGSGKSVFLNSIITQLSQIKNVHLHLFDPKIVELAQFRNVAKEYFSDPEMIYLALEGLVKEMNDRYKELSDRGCRNIDEYNEKGGTMPYKFVVIDEFGDLTVANRTTGRLKKGQINVGGDISSFVLLLAQKARAAGIHMIIATQRPSVDIITGSIKANFPVKVAFRTAKATDSQVVLDAPGAEKLLGKGDMIFSSHLGETRLQGFNI